MSSKHTLTSLLLAISIASKAQVWGLSGGYLLQKSQGNVAMLSRSNATQVYAMGSLGPATQLGALNSFYIAVQSPISKNTYIGLSATQYEHNLLNNKAITINVAQKIKLSAKSSLSLGLNIGAAKTNFDLNTDYGLAYKAAEDILVPQKGSTFNLKVPDISQYAASQAIIGAGVYLNFEKLHIGFGIPNLIKNMQPSTKYPYADSLIERPAYLSIERDVVLNKNFSLSTGINYRASSNAYQKGFDVLAALWYKQKYSLGLAQQRITAEAGQKPLLATAEVSIGKARLAYNFNLGPSQPYTNIKQQILLRLDIDLLKPKDETSTIK
jgi:hypothetical protein